MLSSAAPAGIGTAGVTFREECGDGVVVPVDYDCVCDDFAEAASLAEHAGGVIVDWAPPAGTGSVLLTICHVWNNEQCHKDGGLLKRVGLLPADKDASLVEQEAIVVGAFGKGAPLFLTGWAEWTEVEFMIDTGCQVTILATSVFERMCVTDTRTCGSGRAAGNWC